MVTTYFPTPVRSEVHANAHFTKTVGRCVQHYVVERIRIDGVIFESAITDIKGTMFELPKSI